MIIGFFIYSMGGGGAERTVSLLSEKFCRQGCSVMIYVLEGGEPAYPLESGVRIKI